jgi:UDP-N-acetylmuramoyl-L-alanyl-D-glutamate--2,6-diaminopimelate ligase
MEREKVRMMRDMFQTFIIPFFSWIMTECKNAVPTSHGRIAATLADLAIVTSDNPRRESPDGIIDEVERGMGDTAHQRITDRRAAIAAALDAASEGDTVLLAGKGHETYQVIGTEKVPFDEAGIVHEILGHA